MTVAQRASAGLGVKSALPLALGMACFGSAIPISALAGDGLPVWLAAELRLLVAAALIVPAARIVEGRRADPREAWRRATPTDRLLLAGLGIVDTFAFTVLMF